MQVDLRRVVSAQEICLINGGLWYYSPPLRKSGYRRDGAFLLEVDNKNIFLSMYKLTPNSDDRIETSIAKERLCQARYSFNAALMATAVSASISLVGAALLLSG